MVRETGMYRLVNLFYTTQQLNTLPFDGGWAEQPAYVIDAMTICARQDAIRKERERGQ
jgi:hypothetical protein